MKNQITAAPYLIKKYPLPEKKMADDLSDRHKVLKSPDLDDPVRKYDTKKANRECLGKEYFKRQPGRRQL